MNITKLESEIINAINIEIDNASNVGINDDEYYDPCLELPQLKSFIKKLFKEVS